MLKRYKQKKAARGATFFKYYSSQDARHFTRQAVSVRIRAKNPKRAPLIIAPNTLVAANVTPSNTSDKRIVPKIPTSNTDKMGHTQDL